MESGVTNPRQYYFFTEILAYLQADQKKKKSLQLCIVECWFLFISKRVIY